MSNKESAGQIPDHDDGYVRTNTKCPNKKLITWQEMFFSMLAYYFVWKKEPFTIIEVLSQYNK